MYNGCVLVCFEGGPDQKSTHEHEHAFKLTKTYNTKQAFQKFDTDGSGFLDIDEFSEAMHTLGQRLNKSEYCLIFHEQDKDGSGTIDLVSIASPFLSLVVYIQVVSLSSARSPISFSFGVPL